MPHNLKGRRIRPATAGCVAALIVAALLAFTGIGIAVSVALSGFYEKPPPPTGELVRKKAGLTQYRLEKAAEDGTLSDQEIAHAADGEWRADHRQSSIKVVVRYEVEQQDAPTCYQFEVPAPLGPGTAVERKELERCPASLPGRPVADLSG